LGRGLGSLRKFPYFEQIKKQDSCCRQGSYILELNQKGRQNQKRFCYPASDGSALQSNTQSCPYPSFCVLNNKKKLPDFV